MAASVNSLPSEISGQQWAAGVAGAERPRVALISMPWASVANPSPAMGILKACAQGAGFDADIYYFNLKFAQRLGLELYDRISDAAVVVPEWFFSHALFGPSGSNEMQNSWETLSADPNACDTVSKLGRLVEGSPFTCADIAREQVPRFIAESLAATDWSRYLAVGFTTSFAQSLASLLLALRIKESHPGIKTILGGANVESEMGVELVRGFPWIDYVVHGEAEESFPRLLKQIASRGDERVPGVSLRRGEQVIPGAADARPLADMNASPLPDYSEYTTQLQAAGLAKKMKLRLAFESARGCWWGEKHHCTFCGLNSESMSSRSKDPSRVLREILHLSRTYRCLNLSATDNILTMKYLTELFPKLSEEDLDLSLFYEVKINLKREHLRLLRAAGVTRVQPGIESFSTRVLQLMDKGSTCLQNVQFLKWCQQYNIEAAWNIIYAFPGETAEDYADVARVMRLVSHLRPPVSFSPLRYDRFSVYHGDSRRFGLTLRPAAAYDFIFPKSRVALDKIAYYFDSASPVTQDDPEVYMAPARAALTRWKSDWEKGLSYCYFEKGPDYLIVYDKRARQAGAEPRYRQVHLGPLASRIYLFCDENRSRSSVFRVVRDEIDASVSEAAVTELLRDLVDQELMLEENGRYLSLAIRGEKKSTSPA